MDVFCKFLVRISIFLISIYFITVYAIAIAFEEDFYNDFYVVLLEFCLAVFASVQGNYHCKYARYTAWGIFMSDMITRLDGAYNFIPIGNTAIVSSFILFSSMSITIYLAIRHFSKVTKLKNIQNENRRRNESKNR